MSPYVVPEAVIFDWGGTLTPWHDIDPYAQWRVYAEAVGTSDVDGLTARLVAAEDQAWAGARDAQRSSTIDHVFRAAGVEPAGPAHDAAIEAYQAGWAPHTYTDPTVLGVLAELRARGLALGLLSNTLWTREYHEAVLARDGLAGAFDGLVFSSELDSTKPHADAFLAAVASVGVADPAACVFVGDRLFDDVFGAQAVGMRAVHVPHSAIPEAQRGHTEGRPDAVIDTLPDLLPILDTWLAG